MTKMVERIESLLNLAMGKGSGTVVRFVEDLYHLLPHKPFLVFRTYDSLKSAVVGDVVWTNEGGPLFVTEKHGGLLVLTSNDDLDGCYVVRIWNGKRLMNNEMDFHTVFPNTKDRAAEYLA